MAEKKKTSRPAPHSFAPSQHWRHGEFVCDVERCVTETP